MASVVVSNPEEETGTTLTVSRTANGQATPVNSGSRKEEAVVLLVSACSRVVGRLPAGVTTALFALLAAVGFRVAQLGIAVPVD